MLCFYYEVVFFWIGVPLYSIFIKIYECFSKGDYTHAIGEYFNLNI